MVHVIPLNVVFLMLVNVVCKVHGICNATNYCIYNASKHGIVKATKYCV